MVETFWFSSSGLVNLRKLCEWTIGGIIVLLEETSKKKIDDKDLSYNGTKAWYIFYRIETFLLWDGSCDITVM